MSVSTPMTPVPMSTYGEVEGNLRPLLLNIAEEARLLIRGEFVCEGRPGDQACQSSQKAVEQ